MVNGDLEVTGSLLGGYIECVDATLVANLGVYCPGGGISTDVGNISAGGQVKAGQAKPVAVNDLTRKDYVDQLANDVAPEVNRWASVGGAGTTIAPNNGWACFIPVRCGPCTIDGIGCEVTTAAVAGGNVRLGIYKNHPTRIEPYERFIDAGQIAASTTGFKSISFTPTAWPGGWMWLCLLSQGSTPSASYRGVTGFGEPWTMFGNAQVPPSLVYRAWTVSVGGGSEIWPATLPSLGLSADPNPKIVFKIA